MGDMTTNTPLDDTHGLRIMHVTEAYGGGVAQAISGYIDSTPGLDHLVVGLRREGHQLGDATHVLELPHGGLAGKLRALRNLIAQVQPDLIHAHSSHAGGWVRLLPRSGNHPVVYTPHCFAFERHDVPRAMRFTYRVAESMLAFRLDAYLAASPFEALLAERVARRRVPTYVIPHALHDVGVNTDDFESPSGTFTGDMMTIGRVEPQKGVDFFLAVLKRLRSDGHEIRPLWVGGGERTTGSPLTERLVEAGVTVTGWIERRDVMARLQNYRGIYVHCAEWEVGVPLAVLEAAACGVPAVVREIDAVRCDGWPVAAASVQGIAARVAAFAALSGNESDECRARMRRYIRDKYSTEAQRSALLGAYKSVIAGGS